MTINRTKTDYLAIPDLTYVSLRNAIADTADPNVKHRLTATQRVWLEATDRCGTILDPLASEAHDDVIEFKTPDRQIVTIPVKSPRNVAADITERYGLPVTRDGDRYRVLMTHWPTIATRAA